MRARAGCEVHSHGTATGVVLGVWRAHHPLPRHPQGSPLLRHRRAAPCPQTRAHTTTSSTASVTSQAGSTRVEPGGEARRDGKGGEGAGGGVWGNCGQVRPPNPQSNEGARPSETVKAVPPSTGTRNRVYKGRASSSGAGAGQSPPFVALSPPPYSSGSAAISGFWFHFHPSQVLDQQRDHRRPIHGDRVHRHAHWVRRQRRPPRESSAIQVRCP